MEKRDLRISNLVRKKLDVKNPVFETSQDIASLYKEALTISFSYNQRMKEEGKSEFVSAAKLHATSVLHLLYQTVLTRLMAEGQSDFFTRKINLINSNDELKKALDFYSTAFPSPELEERRKKNESPVLLEEEDSRAFFIHQIMLNNPAMISACRAFINPEGLVYPSGTASLASLLSAYIKDESRNGKALEDEDFFTLLTKPARLYPNSLSEQIKYIIREWAHLLPDYLIDILKQALDFIREEEKDRGMPGPPGPMPVTDYSEEMNEYEAFSDDSNWMPRVVMMAKCTLVWLDQLSKMYKREITRLDQIPDRELDLLKERGFTALWLIGLWERSDASKRIKNLCGNPDAEASAYSLKDYDISSQIGGWEALDNLRQRCKARGIRLASDMVPNHTGLDGNWVYEHPDYYISQDWPPFPSYTYNGPDLSNNPDFEVKIEDHYYDRTDAAVTFRLVDRRNGKVRYVFHGNDGTSMPWNDTAQLDYLNPETREAVIQKIIHVAKNFPIIRFDAAMTLAKRHIQRLWYPKLGEAGDIAGRASHSMSNENFNASIPNEFWREVVDRIASEVPDTLLLAEAFWMMEGYFVRTLGMHRVYNSAFMNMLKNQENEKYRLGIKNTLVFEPEILKRYVNFMNNPDEETAIAQFGDGDRYFGVATLLATLPGLPMVGHGQIEGYHEKYGMEYKRAYWDERPNDYLVGEHYRRIFPLFKRRYLFSNVEHFNLYDCYDNGRVEESVYAYVNGEGNERTLVLYNNRYERVYGNIKTSVPKKVRGKENETRTIQLADNLALSFRARRYVIFENFSDGLFYLMPSIKLFEEGLSFSLNGYESRVYWNIREVEDTDGAYEILYNTYHERGIRDINTAIALIRLRPLYSLFDIMRSRNFYLAIKKIAEGVSTIQDERAMLLTCAEVYTKIAEVYPSFDDVLKAMLGDYTEVDAKLMIQDVKTFSALMKRKNANALNIWADFEDALSFLLLVSVALRPFKMESVADTMKVADQILPEHLFEEAAKEAGLEKDDARLASHAAAIFLKAGDMISYKETKDPVKVLSLLAEDDAIKDFAAINEYQGIRWYNKERMQLLILVSALSLKLKYHKRGFDSDAFASILLNREMESEYQLDKLLKKEEEEKDEK